MNGNLKRTLAVGWFDNAPFQEICGRYENRIKEVFFAWPGVKASRPLDDWTDEKRSRLITDLKWARSCGIELDTIFNASCYGDISLSEELAKLVEKVLGEMEREGLFPDHLTTTSPFIATVVRRRYPSVKLRFSINMDISSTIALKYVDELYDSFYAGRNDHRRLDYIKRMSEWAHAHDKAIGLQVNSGCLRNCPFHHFHNNLHGHNRMGQSAAGEKYGFSVFRCRTNYERGNYEDFLRAIWIRPEDLPLYERFVDVVKLATRRHPDPEAIIRAYATYNYDGDMAAIVDPFFRFPKVVDNKALGASKLWSEVRDCATADNCVNCGKCASLLAEVFKPRACGSDDDLTGSFTGFFKG